MRTRTNGRRIRTAATAAAAACLLLAACVCAAPADTKRAEGRGVEDDPWIVDVDELLRAGLVVTVDEAGPTSLGSADVDTMVVTAPRLRVSELVRRIGEAMEEAGHALGPHAFTQISRATVWNDDDDPEEVGREEYVDVHRIHIDADGERRMTRLRREVRRWKGDEPEETEVEDDLARVWQDDVVEYTLSAPFDLLSANRYRYEIKERTLIGEHLVFRVGFEPKNGFEPGLAGDVWLDVSDFVIRRMEGALVGPMPAAPVMKGVPRFTFTLRRDQGRWVPDGLRAEVLLNGGLPFIPDRIDLEVTLRDYVFDRETPR